MLLAYFARNIYPWPCYLACTSVLCRARPGWGTGEWEYVGEYSWWLLDCSRIQEGVALILKAKKLPAEIAVETRYWALSLSSLLKIQISGEALRAPVTSCLYLEYAFSHLLLIGDCTSSERVATIQSRREASLGEEIFQTASELLVGDEATTAVTESWCRGRSINCIHQHDQWPCVWKAPVVGGQWLG